MIKFYKLASCLNPSFTKMRAKGTLIIVAMALMLSCTSKPETDIRVTSQRETTYTGRGNEGEVLLTLNVAPGGSCRISSVDVRLDAAKNDVERLGLVCDGEILGHARVRNGIDSYTLSCRRTITGGATLEVTADISSAACEGHKVSADVTSINCTGGHHMSPKMPVRGGREIILCRKPIFLPGDYGSSYYRIPALRQLSDGTLLEVNDRRNVNELDLPHPIDVVGRYSTDNGLTWSEPFYVARNEGAMHGYGDPSLVETEDGTVICLFCGGERFTRSCLENPQRSYYSVSHDYGRTWSKPVNITDKVWGEGYHSSFFTSGNSLLLDKGPHKGRILVANVTAKGEKSQLYNHAVYSDDGGDTWHLSDVAYGPGADEAKLVQLTDGRILLSPRHEEPRPYVISDDGGETWGETGYWPCMDLFRCNGDIIRWHGDTLMMSSPTGDSHRDIAIYLSFDDGRSWPYHKVFCHGPGMYSSLTILPDNTIGVIFEKNTVGCELWYHNFTMDWLLTPAPGDAGPEGVQLWEGGPLWGTHNIGATGEEYAGQYFSWGETKPKMSAGWAVYGLCNGSGNTLTKYCTDSEFGTVDGKWSLEPEDDAAALLWGEGWSIPSRSDWQALKDSCRWEWTNVKGADGYKVTGPNGNSIFLPVTGYISGGGSILKECEYFGYYWTDECDPSHPTLGWDFYIQSTYAGCFRGGRDNARCIRPIFHHP